MTRIVLDIETTYTKLNKRTNPSPYLPTNKLVSVGAIDIDTGECTYLMFNHKEVDDTGTLRRESSDKLQDILDEATLIIGHNLKFDMSWLYEAGFVSEAKLYDTMIAEYVFAKGLKIPLNLAACCERYRLSAKSDIMHEYFAKGYNTDDIPMAELIEYGQQDLVSTQALYEYQQARITMEPEYALMYGAVDLMNQTLPVLIDMERNGIYIDLEALSKVEAEYRKEYSILEAQLQAIIIDVMGHTPVNLNSPEHLSQVIYSRKVDNKEKWKDIFNLGTEIRNSVAKAKYSPKMGDNQFIKIVRANTTKLYKTEAKQCDDCKGIGKIFKTKKDGTAYAKATACKACSGRGFNYINSRTYAGLRIAPVSSEYTAIAGFSTDKVTLNELLKLPDLSEQARKFLTCLLRLNAISTYLTTFVEGIRNNVHNTFLHTSFNQCVTATGRLSSSNPNFQNLPRGKTFPVRKVIRSRWTDGKVLSIDFKQLEFRVAAMLAKDEQAKYDILNNVDIHVFTRDTLIAAGQEIDRQDAKIRTFKPLYGGLKGTPAEEVYYKAFLTKYTGIDAWQHKLEDEALATFQVVSPSGRIYAFPQAKRMRNGTVKGHTQIKNYIVQGFATGDINPLALVKLFTEMQKRKLKSKLILTVHDDITIDVYPSEVNEVIEIAHYVFDNMNKFIAERWGIETEIPIEGEFSIGDNWLDKQELKNAA